MMNRRFLLASASALALGARARAATYKVTHTDAEWRQLLTPAQYNILREAGTEPPFSSPLLNEHRKGVFSCAGCTLPLYSSTTKFDLSLIHI